MNKLFLKFLRPEGESAAADGQETEAQVEAQESAAQPEPTSEPEPEPQPVPQATVPLSVMQRRINALTRQKEDLARQLELARLEKVGQPEPQPNARPQPEELDRAVLLAQEIAFNQRADAVAAAGAKIAPDFRAKIVEMNNLHGQLPTPFLATLMEVGESNEVAAEMLYALSKDAVKAAEILGMSPVKQAAALTKLQAELAGTGAKPAPVPPKKPVPGAPPEPIPAKIGGGGQPKSSVDLYSSKTPVEDWMAAREREVREKAKSRRY